MILPYLWKNKNHPPNPLQKILGEKESGTCRNKYLPLLDSQQSL